MSQNPFMVGTLEQPTIVVRTGYDPQTPHIGLLTIGDWTVKCAIGRNGLVDPQLKREGDGKTPRGRHPCVMGFTIRRFSVTSLVASIFRFCPSLKITAG